MRFKTVPALATAALLLCATFAARAQQQQGQQQGQQQVIDDFVTSRGVSFDDPSASGSAQRHTTHTAPQHRSSSGSAASRNHGSNSQGGTLAGNKRTSAKNSSTAGGTEAANNAGAGEGGVSFDDPKKPKSGPRTQNTSAPAGTPLRAIGLGYTIFMKNSAGGLVPVDASREYKSGDQIVIALEPNTDGYLYVFDAENDANPGMLFPNASLDGGANVAHAHERVTYPADTKYAFEFDNNAAIENVYVIVSRHPLEGVPTGDALVAACKKCDEYGWRPTPEQWRRIKAGATDQHVVEAKNTQIAQLQTQPVQPASIQRGIKIKREDPAPAVVRVAGSPDADALVTVIKLVHK